MALGQEVFLIYVKTEIDGEGNTTKAEEGATDEVEEVEVDATAEIEEGYVAKAEGCDTAKPEEDSATEIEDVAEAIECDHTETEEGATDENENGDTVATITEDTNEPEEVYKGFEQEKSSQVVMTGLDEFSPPNFTTCGVDRISRSGTEQMKSCPVGISPNSKMYAVDCRTERETPQLKASQVVIRGLDHFSPLNDKTSHFSGAAGEDAVRENASDAADEDAVRENASDKENLARIDVEKLRAAEHVAESVCNDLAFVWTESRNSARDQLPTQSSLGNPGNCHPNISNNLHADASPAWTESRAPAWTESRAPAWTESRAPARNQLPTQSSLGNPANCHPTISNNLHADASKNLHSGTCRNLPPDTSRNLQSDKSRNLRPDTSKNFQADTSKNVQPDTSKNVHGDQNNDVRKCLHNENNLAVDVLAGKENDLVIVSSGHNEKLQSQISKDGHTEIDHNNFSMNGLSENGSMNAALDKIGPTNSLSYKNGLLDENNIYVNLPSCKGKLSIKSRPQKDDTAKDSTAEENNVRNSLWEDSKSSENSVASSEESDHSMRNSELNISRNTSINSLTSVSSFSDYDPDEAEDEDNECILFKSGGKQNKLNQDEAEQVMAISLDSNSAGMSDKQSNETSEEFIAVDDDDGINIHNTNLDNIKNNTISDKEFIDIEDNDDSTQNHISTNDKEKDQFVKDHKLEGEKLTALLNLLSTGESCKKGSRADTSRRKSSEENNSSRGSSSEDERPKLKKCSSLKTCKSPTGKTNKKLVRFADSFGLEMRCVKTFKDDSVPHIPKSAFDDLDLTDVSTPPKKSPPMRRKITSLVPMFIQPSSSTNFTSLLQSRTVCLENAYIEGDEGNLTGTIRVLNLHFDKSVTVRWTTNDWQDVLDKEANYVHGASDGCTDRFGFRIAPCAGMKLGDRLQFCIKYTTLGTEFWDNNQGANYVFQVFLSHVNPMKGLDHSKTSNYSNERNRSFPKTDHEWGPCSY